MSYEINVGDMMPDFVAKDEEGNMVDSDNLLGSPLIIYFYPKDGTSGCTIEACSFRDNMDAFEGWDAIVIGISPDSAASHRDFIQKNELNFTLLPDEDMELCRMFDVVRENVSEGKSPLTLERTTFVVDPDGVIVWIERPVNVEGHTERILEVLQEMED